MNEKIALADSISHIPDLAAWEQSDAAWYANVDLSKALVYIIDLVDSSALYFLAEQFDVLGYKGYDLCTNDDQRRTLIKNAINLHKYRGTVWSLRQALISVGYQDAVIAEGVESNWAKFSINITLNDSQAVNATQVAALVKLVNEWKNARSILAFIDYSIAFKDAAIVVNDEGSLNPAVIENDSVIVGIDNLYNGVHLFDGSTSYSSDGDTLEITIINV